MKRVLFLASHLKANAERLVALLQLNQRIQFYNNALVYKHPLDIALLHLLPHKEPTTAAIYAALLLDNNDLSGRALYKFCNFVYFIRRPKPTITELISAHYDPQTAIDLYILRIRRLYEMAFQTPGAVFLTWDDLKENRGLDLIEKYLYLKSPLSYNPDYFTEPDNCVLQSQVQEAEEAYEGIIYRMKQLKHLKFVSQ